MKYLPIAILFFISFSSKAIDRYWDGGGDGISWHDAANWDAGGVPTTNDDAIIDDDSVVVSTDVQIKNIALFADLTITASASMLVSNGSITLIIGKANDISNSGNLVILNGALNIPEDGRYFNKSGSSLSISGGLNGIVNEGKLLNRVNAEMYLSHTSGIGFKSSGFVDNRGFLQIFQCDAGMEISTNSFSLEKAELVNSGEIQIFDTVEKGIENIGGIIDNENRLLVYENLDYSILSRFGNGFSSEMYNRSGAKLIVRAGLVAGNYFQNDGILKAENAGFVALGSGDKFINNDTLYISSLEYSGLLGGDTLINSSTGVILADSLKGHSSFASYLISSQGYFQNLGKIDLGLDEQIDGIYNNGYLENEGDIIIFKAKESGLLSEGTLVNALNSEIIIDSLLSGIAFQNSDTLENYGLILIKNAQNATGYFQNFSYSWAENFGTFQILDTHAGQNAFFLTDGQFTNSSVGLVDLKRNELVNYTVKNKKTLINKGEFLLDCPIGNHGIINELNSSYTALPFVLNSLNFTIVSPDTIKIGFENQGRFINDECAVFRNQSVILNETGGLISNNGVFRQKGLGKIVNNGSFHNDAVVTSKDRVFDNVIDDQVGLMANAFYHPIQSNFTFSVYWDNQFATSSIPETWYDEEALSTIVGTYDSTTALFTTSSAPTNGGLFFKILRPFDDCDLLVEIPINIEQPYCEQYEQKVFDAGTNNWFTNTNWQDGKIPNVCSDVLIPTGQNVIIPTSHYGVSHKLEIASGAVFEAFSGAVLDVRNDL